MIAFCSQATVTPHEAAGCRRGGVVDTVGRTAVRSRPSPPDTPRARCRWHPQRAPFSRPLSGDQSDPGGPASDGYLPAAVRKCRTRGPLAKRAVKQRGAKNGESENPQKKSRGPRGQPPWLHAAPHDELSKRRIEDHAGRGVNPWKEVRYDKTPKGSPSGVSH